MVCIITIISSSLLSIVNSSVHNTIIVVDHTLILKYKMNNKCVSVSV